MQLVGVIHLLPLPGSPRAAGMGDVLTAAEVDARALIAGGADAVIVENFGDVPFFADRVEPVTVAAMARAVERVRGIAGARPVGVNVLRNDAIAALSVAHVCGGAFVRVNVHAGAAVTDQGLVQSRAAETLRLRQRLGADVQVWADVGVKHAAALGIDDPTEEARDALERGLADALIVTGAATGARTDPATLRRVREAVPGARLLVGSGVSPDQVEVLREHADGVIVGTWLKRDGAPGQRIDAGRVARLREAIDG